MPFCFTKFCFNTDKQLELSFYFLFLADFAASDIAKSKLEEAVKNGVNESTALANAAQEGGLLSREEFSKANSIEEKNSRQARNNRILDDMLRILQSDEAFEENIG